MKKALSISFVASECQPFVTSGGLADVIGSLPKKIIEADSSKSVDVYVPFYATVKPEFACKFEDLGTIEVQLSWRRQYAKIYKYVMNNVNYYFIDNEYYFKRDRLYGYFDDAERFAFFSKAVIEAMLQVTRVPDIIHCHDWQAAMTLVYLRTLYYHVSAFNKTKRLFTIHNIEYQGIYSFDTDIVEDVFGIDNNDGYLLEYNGSINLMKAAMECANKVTTVSPNYAEEIKTPLYAHELEDEVNRVDEEGKLVGILNGIDYDFYNPETDKALFNNYSIDTLEERAKNKKELQKMLGLPARKTTPVIGMVTRLVWHKGLEYLKKSFDSLMAENIELVILGTGDIYYENFFSDMAKKYPDKCKVILTFNQDLSRKIYSGVDFFLMPSASEPCGLSQMIACRYGAVPMVRATGGLKDSIHEFTEDGGNGYRFESDNADDLVLMVKRALKDFKKKDFNELIKRCMTSDFSWKASAKKYIDEYTKLTK